MEQSQIKSGVKVRHLPTGEIWEVAARNYNEVLLIFRGLHGKAHATKQWDDFNKNFELVISGDK